MKSLAAFAFGVMTSQLPAQTCSPNWVPTFGEAPGTGGGQLINCTAVVDIPGPLPRALFVGGNFTRLGATAARGLGAWNGDRWIDPTPGLNGPVTALVEHDDGTGRTLFVAGNFQIDSPSGPLSCNVARWNGQTWSAVGSNYTAIGLFNDLVVCDLGSGPELIMAGHRVLPAVDVARWNGVAWSSMNIANGTVSSLSMFDDGSGVRLYAARRAGPSSRVVRWENGAWTQVGGLFSDDVITLETHLDASGVSLHAGGEFTQVGGSLCAGVARWDGQAWQPVGAGIGPTVSSLKSLNDGGGPKLFASGVFAPGNPGFRGVAYFDGQSWVQIPGTQICSVTGLEVYAGRLFVLTGCDAAGVAGNGILSWDGAQFVALGDGISHTTLLSLASYDDTGSGAKALFVGGRDPLRIGGHAYHGVARWDGVRWSNLAAGLSGGAGGFGVMGFKGFDDGLGAGPQLYVCGEFSSASGVASNLVARWGPSGWSAAGFGQADGVVHALEVYDAGAGPALYAGGSMQVLGGSQRGFARWNGSSWTWLGGLTFPQTIFALAVFDDGSGKKLYAGGQFSGVGGVVGTVSIARWSAAGWESVGGGVQSEVRTLCVFDDGSGPALYAGGNFTMAGGAPASRVARWNGTQWQPLGDGFSSMVWSLTTAPFGPNGAAQLFAAGDFVASGATPILGVARWNGASWESIGSTSKDVRALLAHDDGAGGGVALFAAGNFATSPGRDSYLAKWGCDSDAVVAYCTPMTSTSGCAATISATGVARVDLSGSFVLEATQVDGSRNGLFFYGVSGRSAAPYGVGVLCVKPPVRRLNVAWTGGAATNCDGVLASDWSAFVAADPLALGRPLFAGQRIQAQGWVRDAQQAIGATLTGGLEFEIQP